jgi:hypothetical protein
MGFPAFVDALPEVELPYDGTARARAMRGEGWTLLFVEVADGDSLVIDETAECARTVTPVVGGETRRIEAGEAVRETLDGPHASLWLIDTADAYA